jgi:hypothetical protein
MFALPKFFVIFSQAKGYFDFSIIKNGCKKCTQIKCKRSNLVKWKNPHNFLKVCL